MRGPDQAPGAAEAQPRPAPAPPRARPAPPPLRGAETELRGELRDTPHGPAWVARAFYSDDFRHGRRRVGWARAWDVEALGLVAHEPRAAPLPPQRWALVDLETTGLGADAGTYAFLVGVGWLEPGGFVVEQHLLRDPADEPALLHEVARRLAAFEGVVSFNGKSFDLPLLATRCLLARRAAPCTGWPHCDLLPAARRLWPHRTRDRRLATLEAELLGVRRPHDVPSALIPQRYAAYLRGGDAATLDDVLAHNRFDLLSLLFLVHEAASFLPRLREDVVGSRPAERQLLAEDRLRGAVVLHQAGHDAAAANLLESCLAGDPSPAARLAALRSLAALRKRAGEIDAACALWRDMLALAPECIEPYEELAKAHEHRRREPRQAMDWVDRALQEAALDRVDRAALLHRRQRLGRKLQRASLWDSSPGPDAGAGRAGSGATSGFPP
jgi:uncharacterized protein YprB with RNaseH-like and TPR domain